MPTNTKKTLAEISKRAKPMEKIVPVCIRGDLVAEHERLERDLQRVRDKEASQARLGSGKKESVRIAEQIEAVQAEMREDTYDFRFRAVSPRAWSDLMAAHPSGDPKKMFNIDTFSPAAIALCCVEPEGMDDAEALGEFLETLNPAQQDQLFSGAWEVNSTAPKEMTSFAASVVLRGSETNSSSATPTESLAVSSSVA